MFNFLQCVKKIEKFGYDVLKEMIIRLLPWKSQNTTIISGKVYLSDNRAVKKSWIMLWSNLSICDELALMELQLKRYHISVIFSDTKNASFCDRFVIEVLKSAVKNFQKNVDWIYINSSAILS